MTMKEYRKLLDTQYDSMKSMKSTDLNKFVTELTGKFSSSSDFHEYIKKMLNIKSTDSLRYAQTLGKNKQLLYYNLSKVECKMLMLNIDSRHLRLLSELFEKPEQQDSKVKVEELTTTVQTTCSLHGKLDKKIKKLTIDNLQLDRIEKIARLAKTLNLEQLESLKGMSSNLIKDIGTLIESETKDIKTLVEDETKEVREASNGVIIAVFIRETGLRTFASKLYFLLSMVGVAESYKYTTTTRGKTVLGWRLTELGRYYGYNDIYSSANGTSCRIRLYEDRFEELVNLLEEAISKTKSLAYVSEYALTKMQVLELEHQLETIGETDKVFSASVLDGSVILTEFTQVL